VIAVTVKTPSHNCNYYGWFRLNSIFSTSTSTSGCANAPPLSNNNLIVALKEYTCEAKTDAIIQTAEQVSHKLYRVHAQIKQSHFTFPLVTNECIYKTHKLIKQQMARCQFYVNECVTR